LIDLGSKDLQPMCKDICCNDFCDKQSGIECLDLVWGTLCSCVQDCWLEERRVAELDCGSTVLHPE